MIISFVLLAIVFFAAGYAFHRDWRALDKTPEPPLLDTPESVINYLEACSLDQNNPDMNELFCEFRLFVNQKQLSAGSTVDEGLIPLQEEKKPDWFHNPQATVPPDKHWEVFFADLKRETDPDAKIGVVKHWMLDLQNGFTFKEMEMILDQFDDSDDRAAVRKIYATRKNAKKKKKQQFRIKKT